MECRHSNPAIYAGIAGAATFAVPTYAHAVEVFGTNIPLSETGLAFVGGCVSGAVVASGVSVVVEHLMYAAEDKRAAERELGIAAARSEAKHAAGQRAPKHAQTSQSVAVSGKHVAPAGRSNASYGRHSAAARAVEEWEKTGEIRSLDFSTSAFMQAAQAETPRVHTADESSSSVVSAQQTDYADVAESYVKKITLAERMSARAKGVADVLYERLNANKMDGLPVIARADGTVADMGVAWWDNAFDEQQLSAASFSEVADVPAVPQNYQVQALEAQPQTNSLASRLAEISLPEPEAPNPYQAQPLQTQKEAEVQARAQELVEDLRWSDKQQDLWAVALNALDERFAEQIALGPTSEQNTFVDEVGDLDSIDEPEGLEPPTQFMSFKPTAGHPEVQDTNSYVDLLIDQEFAQNSSTAARKSVRGVMRNYLKIVEGGTGQIAKGKHFAPAVTPAAQMAY